MKAIAGAALIFPTGPGAQAASSNDLLRDLGAEDLARLVDRSERIILDAGSHLARHGDKVRRVQFPIDGYASLIATDGGQAQMQVALVGPEGLLGWESLTTQGRYLFDVCIPETLQALSLEVDLFRTLIAGDPQWMAAHVDCLARAFEIAARGVVCARFHPLEQRLARFLLEVRDIHRHRQKPIHLTQSTLATLLGVRRSGVTNAATHLQLLGLITYRRGEITILDRPGLEQAACDCYRRHVDRQLV